MNIQNIKIIETVVVVVAYIAIRLLTNTFIDRTVSNKFMQKARGKIIKKAVNLVLVTTFSVFILIIWGVNQDELAFFVGSILTVIGVAFFAQWSILSNVTSGIILFFYHSVKLDDTVSIIDKDYEVQGRVSDIGLFFVIFKTDKGETITVPNSVFMQKMIKKGGPPNGMTSD